MSCCPNGTAPRTALGYLREWLVTTVWCGKPDWMEWEEGRERVRD